MAVVIAEIMVRPDEARRFVAACLAALRHVTDVPGCRSVRLTRSIGDPARFLVITEWTTIEALHRDFYETEHFVRWREEVSHFFLEPPRIEQCEEIDAPVAAAPDR